MAKKPPPRNDLSRDEMIALVTRIVNTGGKRADIDLFVANCKHPDSTDLIYWPHGDQHDPSKPEPTVEEIVDRAMNYPDPGR
jgi:hypothetical protein